MKRFALFLPLLALICFAGSIVPLVLAEVEYVVNGAMLDTDGDNRPDDWQGINLLSIDRVRCYEGVCSFEFGSFNQPRSIQQIITPADLTGVTTVTFSFDGRGKLFEPGATGTLYVYRVGQRTPAVTEVVTLPVWGIGFNQTYTRVVDLPADTTYFKIAFTSAQQGSWAVSRVSLQVFD